MILSLKQHRKDKWSEMLTETQIAQAVKMRRGGASYREIAAKIKTSHEQVRRVLLADEINNATSKTEFPKGSTRARVKELTDWLNKHGPVSRERVTEEFGYDRAQITALTRAGAPSHLIMSSSKSTEPQVSDAEVLVSLRRAWNALREEVPGASGLSHVSYERVRDPKRDLSAARITTRYGWVQACEKAGIPSGGVLRPTKTYTQRWNDEGILRAVRTYASECLAEQRRPTYLGYDRWQRGKSEMPSGSLVRVRMQKIGLRTWPQTIEAALALND